MEEDSGRGGEMEGVGEREEWKKGEGAREMERGKAEEKEKWRKRGKRGEGRKVWSIYTYIQSSSSNTYTHVHKPVARYHYQYHITLFEYMRNTTMPSEDPKFLNSWYTPPSNSG